eukprot:COSAG06_NODE_31566_length_519_cov_0.978571_1_plen_145_part_10
MLAAESEELLDAREQRDAGRAARATQAVLKAVKRCHSRLNARCLQLETERMQAEEGDSVPTTFVEEYMRSAVWAEMSRSHELARALSRERRERQAQQTQQAAGQAAGQVTTPARVAPASPTVWLTRSQRAGTLHSSSSSSSVGPR